MPNYSKKHTVHSLGMGAGTTQHTKHAYNSARDTALTRVREHSTDYQRSRWRTCNEMTAWRHVCMVQRQTAEPMLSLVGLGASDVAC